MATSTTWVIDPTHSEIQFKVKHLVISTVTGSFKEFEGSIKSVDGEFDGATVNFSAATDSIDTNQAQRDEHLKSADFFDSATHPKLIFSNGKLSKKNGSDFVLEGLLTIKGESKAVKLDVDFGGNMTDSYGNAKSGFELTGKINRKDFGLTWGAVTEAGGVVVGDEVKLIANIQVVKQ